MSAPSRARCACWACLGRQAGRSPARARADLPAPGRTPAAEANPESEARAKAFRANCGISLLRWQQALCPSRQVRQATCPPQFTKRYPNLPPRTLNYEARCRRSKERTGRCRKQSSYNIPHSAVCHINVRRSREAVSGALPGETAGRRSPIYSAARSRPPGAC
jgi:hypothetical protein